MSDETFDIARVFALDPLSLTDKDLDATVAYYRANREKALLGPVKAAAKVKGERVKSAVGDLDIEI